MLTRLPLTASIAAMGAAMVSLIDHARDARTPAPTAWMLCAGATAVLTSTMILAACLRAWHEERSLYRPLACVCAVVAIGCLALGAAPARPAAARYHPGAAPRHPMERRGRPPAHRRRVGNCGQSTRPVMSLPPAAM
jgi:hypothetical protein